MQDGTRLDTHTHTHTHTHKHVLPSDPPSDPPSTFEKDAKTYLEHAVAGPQADAASGAGTLPVVDEGAFDGDGTVAPLEQVVVVEQHEPHGGGRWRRAARRRDGRDRC